jgi:hypothetical protein
MTPTEIRNTVRTLQAQRHSLREISRILALSRNTVRRILRQPDRSVAETAACDEATLARLKAAFERARGNVVRVQEVLADDGLDVRYSTLTRCWCGRPPGGIECARMRSLQLISDKGDRPWIRLAELGWTRRNTFFSFTG